MATIGLDKLYYAKITEDENGLEIYGSPIPLAKAMTAELSVELAEATLYADDGAAEVVKEFQSGTLSLGIADIGARVAEDLTGAVIDGNKVLISTSEDNGGCVAVGFRAKKSNGKYRYFWLYRVKFGIPATNLTTKGESIEFSTPTIEGTVMRRNKPDILGKHPWKAEVNEDDTGVPTTVISEWYKAVYEPKFDSGACDLSSLTLGALTLAPTFSVDVTEYTATTTNATNTVTAVAADSNASVIIINGSTEVANGSAVTWNDGVNTLTVTITNGENTKTYIVTVEKS